jgi:hypothetical protein
MQSDGDQDARISTGGAELADPGLNEGQDRGPDEGTTSTTDVLLEGLQESGLSSEELKSVASIDLRGLGDAGLKVLAMGLTWSRQRADIARDKALVEQEAKNTEARLELEKQMLEQEATNAQARFELEKEMLEQKAEAERNEFELANEKAKSEEGLKKDLAALERDREQLDARLRYTNDRVRGIVLYLVVLALVVMPLVAMGWFNINAQEFAQYVAPITGIAGTVLGYWFGRKDLSG